MLSTAINCKSPRLSRALPEAEESRAAPAAPPVILVHPTLDPEQYPSAIFGNLPAGFDLGRADIRLLVHWQRKAIAAVENLPETANDDDFTEAMRPVNLIFKAIKGLKLDYPSGIALQMKAIAEVAEWFDGESESSAMEDLSTAEFRHLAASLDAALVRHEPTKRVGPLTRGRKLTTAGLLHRYHAFLVQELETLGLKLYGSSEYAPQMRPADVAVNERCSNRHESKARRKIYPFFDESTLSTRARTVLESLEIDTERDGSSLPMRRRF
jgi:hypothetical protein